MIQTERLRLIGKALPFIDWQRVCPLIAVGRDIAEFRLFLREEIRIDQIPAAVAWGAQETPAMIFVRRYKACLLYTSPSPRD